MRCPFCKSQPTICPMNSKEAKDFLVEQTARQATMESVPLSALEKRMMYFSETDECPEDPIALNDAFEAESDTAAYQRIKKEDLEALHRWKGALKELSQGDHYILVLCRDGSPARPTSVALKFPVLATVVTWLLLGLVGTFLAVHFGMPSGGRRGRYVAPSGVQTSLPLWLQRLLWSLIVGGYLYYVILPWVLKRPLPGLVSVFAKLIRRRRRPRR